MKLLFPQHNKHKKTVAASQKDNTQAHTCPAHLAAKQGGPPNLTPPKQYSKLTILILKQF